MDSNEGEWVNSTENDGGNSERGGNKKDHTKEALTNTINSLNGMTATLTTDLEVVANVIKARTEVKTLAKENKEATSVYCRQKIAKIKRGQDMIKMDEDITPLTSGQIDLASANGLRGPHLRFRVATKMKKNSYQELFKWLLFCLSTLLASYHL